MNDNKDIIEKLNGNSAPERDELEELRKQVNELRSELENSKIVNERIIRQAMRGRSSWLGTFVKAEAVAIPITTLIFGGFLYLFNASLWPAIIFFIISVISTWFDTRTMVIHTKAISSLPMYELKSFLQKQKKQRLIQLLIESPLVILWAIWFFMEIRSTLTPGSIADAFFSDGLAIGLGVGLFVGMIIVAIIYIKAQNTNDALIDTIDANSNEEN